MTTQVKNIFRKTLKPLAMTLFWVLPNVLAQAATVSGGSLVLNLNRDALIAGVLLDTYPDAPTPNFAICCRPSIYLEEFYDAAAASNRTFVQIQQDNTPDLYDLVSDEIPATGLQFDVNGSVVGNPGGRANKPTTFAFDPDNLFGTATGSIGLGGVMRFRVDVNPPTNRIMVGDLTLEYDANVENAATGRSGWTLMNNISFTAGAFELYDVSTQLTGDSLSINGNLGFGDGFDHIQAGAARLNGARIGTFSFQTTVVPLPPSAWLFVSALLGLSSRYWRKQSIINVFGSHS